MNYDYTISGAQQGKQLPNIIFILGVIIFAVAFMNGSIIKFPEILATIGRWFGIIFIVIGAGIEVLKRKL